MSVNHYQPWTHHMNRDLGAAYEGGAVIGKGLWHGRAEDTSVHVRMSVEPRHGRTITAHVNVKLR